MRTLTALKRAASPEESAFPPLLSSGIRAKIPTKSLEQEHRTSREQEEIRERIFGRHGSLFRAVHWEFVGGTDFGGARSKLLVIRLGR